MHQTKTGILLANFRHSRCAHPRGGEALSATIPQRQTGGGYARLLWWPLLRGVILPIRSPRVAKLYQSVWMEEGSPLMVYSRRQQQALAARLPDTPVALGMSYGSPSLASAVDDLLAQGVEHIVVLPLYPQYSCSTVAAVWDELARILAKKRAIPGISFIRDYAEHPDYIHALAASVRASFAVHGEPDLLLLSYHGIPQRYANQGDDYPQRCRDTTRELVSALGLPPERVMMTFQSRFGREPWLTPYTDETLKMLGEKGTKHIQVLCPGFAADCLETLEEIAVQNREIFLEAGGKQYEYIPALNADAAHIEMMVNLTAPYR